MSRRLALILLALTQVFSPGWGQMRSGQDFKGGIRPTTVQFAVKDSVSLMMDIYEPENGKDAPTVIFMFGGGFKGGRRNGFGETAWCSTLCRNGIRAVAIDYRLGLKDMHGINLKSVGLLHNAITIAVEDLYSATVFLIENRESMGIDTSRLVIAGSSAGALSVLQAEYEICNGHEIAGVLPSDFNYAGVMSFSGAVFTKDGRLRYREKDPCPHLMLHGTADHIVLYKGIKVFRQNFTGTHRIAKVFKKNGYPCVIMRFDGNGHEVASAYNTLSDECIDFIGKYVNGSSKAQSDALISDPTIRPSEWGRGNFSRLY